MAAKLVPVQIARRITLAVFFVGVTVLSILHQRVQNIPTIDSLDPFGGLETLLKWLAGGEIIKKLAPGNIVLFGGILALGIVLARFFCGWFCAFGALQGIFGWLGRKIFRKRFTVPLALDKALRWIKYPLLAAIIFLTWTTGTLIIRPYDPFAAYGHLSAGMEAVWGEFAVGLVILVASLVFSMLYERAFCKYLCPLGAVNALLGRIPLFRIRRVASTCISCSRCDKTCPMNIDISHANAVESAECISCMECVTICPTKKGTLVPTLIGKTVKAGFIVALGFGIYLGVAAIGQAADMLHFVGPSLSQAAAAGKLRVEDIKGSNTWAMVAESFGIDLERLYRETGVDPKKVPPATMLKDTAKAGDIKDFEADAVRVAVAKILGLPYSGEGGTTALTSSAPPPAIPLSAEKSASAQVAPSPDAAPAPIASPPTAAKTTTLVVPPGFALEGTMSIRDIATALKATEEEVIVKLGLPADIPTDRPLRDIKDQYGYTMPALKERINR